MKRREKFSHVQIIIFYKIVSIDTEKGENIQTSCSEIQNYYFDNHNQVAYICNSNICDLSLSFTKLKFNLNLI